MMPFRHGRSWRRLPASRRKKNREPCQINMFLLLVGGEWQGRGGTWKEAGSANEPYFKNTTQPWIFNSSAPWWGAKMGKKKKNEKKNKIKKQNSKNKENLKDLICRKPQLKLPLTDKQLQHKITISPLFATKCGTVTDFHQGRGHLAFKHCSKTQFLVSNILN